MVKSPFDVAAGHPFETTPRAKYAGNDECPAISHILSFCLGQRETWCFQSPNNPIISLRNGGVHRLKSEDEGGRLIGASVLLPQARDFDHASRIKST